MAAQQRIDVAAAGGGDDGLAQAAGPGLFNQCLHAGPERDAALFDQRRVEAVLQPVQLTRQRLALGGQRGRVGARAHVGQQALAASRHAQQLAVARFVPAPGQAQGLEGAVEGHAVAVALGFGQRAVHVPEQRVDHAGASVGFGHGTASAASAAASRLAKIASGPASAMGRPAL